MCLLARRATPVVQLCYLLPPAARTLVSPLGVAALNTPRIEEAGVGEGDLEAEKGRGGSIESGKDFDSGKAAAEGTVELSWAEEFSRSRRAVLCRISESVQANK